jgi:hypothetical protein
MVLLRMPKGLGLSWDRVTAVLTFKEASNSYTRDESQRLLIDPARLSVEIICDQTPAPRAANALQLD